MGRIRGADTAPEMVVRRLVHGLGYRYVLHDRRLPGTPDLAFPSRRKVILVHGCFWHGHDCGRGFKPKTNVAFWTKKLKGNQLRDARTLADLNSLGWQTLVVWECEVRLGPTLSLQRRLVRFLEG